MVVIAFILVIIAGVAKAVMDKVNFHFSRSIFINCNALFWDPIISSRNKWKDGIEKRGPKFFGSSTFLVGVTDAWHLFGTIYGITFSIAFLLIGKYGSLWMFPVAYILSRSTFELFFKYIFEKK